MVALAHTVEIQCVDNKTCKNLPLEPPNMGLLSKSAKFIVELVLLEGGPAGMPNGSTLFPEALLGLAADKLPKSTRNPDDVSSGVKVFGADSV